MTTLLLKLFGSPQILLGDDPLVVRPRNSIKARAILYYLAVLGEPVTRERLAGLFWSDWPEQKARAYLRGELHLLGDLKGEYLIDADGRVGLNLDRCRSDVQRLAAVAGAPAPTLEELHAADRAYAGPLLDGIDSMLEDSSPLFVEWLRSERDRFEGQFRQILYRLAAACADEGRMFNVGIDACTRLLAEEPEREEVHRLKMRVLALDGQRAAALKQYDECASALMDELGVPPSAETNALYDRILAGDFDRVTAAPEAARPAPFQAIAAPGHLIGRREEVARVVAMLTQPGRAAVVAVVGMGGVGKTALAAAVANDLRSAFPDGILWGRVATDEPMDILQSWAVAYDRDLSKIASPAARAAAMRSLLADKRALIVLDDVVAGRPIDLLLPGATACPVLITTRDRAEVALHTTEIVDLRELPPQEGVELLVQLLGAETIAADRPAAEALCSLLGGLPLAVEIAAQRVVASPRRDLARMVRSLHSASARLAHGISNRSVRTSFSVSWDALAGPLQRTFALMGLFDGRSFSAEAIATICSNEPDAALDELDLLVTLSMLKFASDERFVQHRLLADFAQEKLADLPDRLDAQRRFVAYYTTLAQRSAGDFARLEHEWDHLLHAVEIARNSQSWPELLALVDAAAAPWFARARFHHARQGFLAGLEAAEALGDTVRRPRYAFFLGRIALRQDDYAAARELLGAAIDGFRANGNEARMAEALVDLADVYIEQGEYEEADARLRRAETLWDALTQPAGLAAVRCRQGLIAYFEQDLGRAEQLCQEGLAFLDQRNDEIVRSRTLRLLTDIALYRKELARAGVHLRQADEANRTVGDQTETAAILFAQAKLDHHLGYHAEALVNARESVALYAAMGDRKAQLVLSHMISRLHQKLGEAEPAQLAAQEALQIATDLGDEAMQRICIEQLEITRSMAAA
ncbi:MAG: tetratricopeptide repeat protein [Caldilineaceae bacterium]|nr:tetratricopeptide repeat protein [Caldilineaceae bacterium]